MKLTLRLMPAFFLLLLAVLVVASCGGQPRYSDDPAAARIQGLTDFCIGYGALRDAATHVITVDAARTTPVLSADLVEGYAAAREFIKPYCAVSFDPQTELFDLNALKLELTKIRLVVLEQENSQ